MRESTRASWGIRRATLITRPSWLSRVIVAICIINILEYCVHFNIFDVIIWILTLPHPHTLVICSTAQNCPLHIWRWSVELCRLLQCTMSVDQRRFSDEVLVAFQWLTHWECSESVHISSGQAVECIEHWLRGGFSCGKLYLPSGERGRKCELYGPISGQWLDSIW